MVLESYETQTKLYQDYVNQDGKAAADRYSARPGYSEHQTGLAFDVIGTDGDLVTEEKAAQWLLDHAADYGFVVRYLKGKEKETGYMAEEWHLRYVGKEAKEIAESGLSFITSKTTVMIANRETCLLHSFNEFDQLSLAVGFSPGL